MKEKSFEEKLEELEKIVNELESGEVKLDSAIEKYSKAMKLAKECSDKLNTAEKTITKILNDNGTLSDFEVKNDDE